MDRCDSSFRATQDEIIATLGETIGIDGAYARRCARYECSAFRIGIHVLPLILFAETLDVRLAAWIEELLATLLPRGPHFRRCGIPVRTALLQNRAKVLAEFFHSGPAEEPVAVIDLINHKTGLKDNDVGDHGIVERIRVFGDVEIFLDNTPRVREERPVGTDTVAIFTRLSNIVGANRDEPAIPNLELTMELDQPLNLPTVLGSVTSAAEDEDQWILSLQFGELPVFRSVVGKLVVGEDSPGDHGRSHMKPSSLGCVSPGYVAMVSSRRSHSSLGLAN